MEIISVLALKAANLAALHKPAQAACSYPTPHSLSAACINLLPPKPLNSIRHLIFLRAPFSADTFLCLLYVFTYHPTAYRELQAGEALAVQKKRETFRLRIESLFSAASRIKIISMLSSLLNLPLFALFSFQK